MLKMDFQNSNGSKIVKKSPIIATCFNINAACAIEKSEPEYSPKTPSCNSCSASAKS